MTEGQTHGKDVAKQKGGWIVTTNCSGKLYRSGSGADETMICRECGARWSLDSK